MEIETTCREDNIEQLENKLKVIWKFLKKFYLEKWEFIWKSENLSGKDWEHFFCLGSKVLGRRCREEVGGSSEEAEYAGNRS